MPKLSGMEDTMTDAQRFQAARQAALEDMRDRLAQHVRSAGEMLETFDPVMRYHGVIPGYEATDLGCFAEHTLALSMWLDILDETIARGEK